MTLIETYDDLRKSFIERRKQLNMTQEDVNFAAGLQGGYQNKIECKVRNVGFLSLPMILAALDLEIILKPEPMEPAP